MAKAEDPRERKNSPSAGTELRRQAEEHLGGLAAASSAPEDVSAAVHELRVHQIELEMQNEQLRMAQLELAGEREKYFELFDLAPVGYLTLAERGVTSDANLTAVQLLGAERQLLVGQPFSAFVFAPDRNVYYDHQQALQRTGEPQTGELRLQRLGGTGDAAATPGHFWAHLEWRLRAAADEDPVCWVTFSDISERKQAEAAVRDHDQAIRQAYIDVLDAVTGGKLILLWPPDLLASLGDAIMPIVPITQPSELAGARRRLVEVLGGSTGSIDEEVLAVHEALANVLKHGEHGEYSVRRTSDCVQVVVTDFGPGIDFQTLPKAALVPGFSTKPSLGMGFTIMLEVAERVLLATEPGLTMLVLEFDRRTPSARAELDE